MFVSPWLARKAANVRLHLMDHTRHDAARRSFLVCLTACFCRCIRALFCCHCIARLSHTRLSTMDGHCIAQSHIHPSIIPSQASKGRKKWYHHTHTTPRNLPEQLATHQENCCTTKPTFMQLSVCLSVWLTSKSPSKHTKKSHLTSQTTHTRTRENFEAT